MRKLVTFFILWVCLSAETYNASLLVQLRRENWLNETRFVREELEVLHALGNRTYLVREPRREHRRRRLEAMVDLLPKRRLKMRYHPGLHKLIISSSVSPEELLVDVAAELPMEHFKVVRSLEEGLGEYLFLLRVEGDGRYFNETLYRLVHHPHVIWVDYFHKARVNNYHTQLILTGLPPELFPYSGEGETIAVGDTGVDLGHCAFRSPVAPLRFTYTGKNKEEIRGHLEGLGERRVKAYLNMQFEDFDGRVAHSDFGDRPMGHGTHVCGSALGDFQECHQKGQASRASLVFFDFEDLTPQDESDGLVIPPSLTGLLELSYVAGARVGSHSWGMPLADYTHYAMEMDRFVYFHDEYVLLVAAGNTGPEDLSISAPSTLKNGISVGCSQNSYESTLEGASFWEGVGYGYGDDGLDLSPENLADFSSRGPTSDGRIKPDVVAPGEFTLSARAGGGPPLLWMRGTSMATPALARFVASIRELLRKRHNLPYPSAALVKNLVVCGAVPLQGFSSHVGRGVDGKLKVSGKYHKPLGLYEQGFGRATFGPLLAGEFRFLDRQKIEAYHAPHRYRFRAKEAGMVTVGLVWTDAPGYLHEERALVNDLNLYVRVFNRNETRHIVLGNHFQLPDHVNTVERVRLKVIKDEVVEVLVSTEGPLAVLPPISHQTYSLVFSALLEDLPGEETCDMHEPPWQCIGPFQEGEVPCRDGKYQKGLCLPLCKGEGCTCYRHLPCGHQGQEGEVNFTRCEGGNLTVCKAQLEWRPQRLHTQPSLTRLLRLLASDATVSWDLWFCFFLLLMFFTLVILLISSWDWWQRRYVRKRAFRLNLPT